MIPKKIHYIWIGNSKNIPKIEKEWIKEVKKLHKGWEVKIWTEKDVPTNKFLEKCIAEKAYSYAADYIRAYALYNEGGFYLDTDVKLLKQIPNEWLSYEVVLPKESDWFLGFFFCGTMKKNRFAKSVLDVYINFIDNNQPLNKDELVSPKIIMPLIKRAYGVWGICYQHNGKFIGDQRCLILDEKYMCPYYPWDKNRINDKVDTTYSIGVHYWNNYKQDNGLDLLSFDSKYFDNENIPG